MTFTNWSSSESGSKQHFWQEAHLAKCIRPEQLEKVVESLRKQGKTIATINGSFDLLHAGHLHILYEAHKQADTLIVGLNSDESIRRYKSPDRPIVPLRYRLELIAALCFVSYVTWFDETDPRRWLARIRPDVHVNGAEYGRNCIEADTVLDGGGRLHLVERIGGLSTSDVLRRARECG
jgi:D-glycero-beta-D-manno-heptose 1-phosphate adenylyltransferase